MGYLKKNFVIVFILGFSLCSWLALAPPAGVPILEYHMVGTAKDPSGEIYAVPPEEFRQQLDYLVENGYTTITMLEFIKAAKGKFDLPEKPIILTFDDGYKDNYTTMLPMLEERGMKATVFMVTNDIGTEGYLTWDDLRDMQNRGIEIGSHTANHLPLTSLSPKKQDEEVRLSKLIMEWNGIKTVFSFSYPNGAYDSGSPELLQKNEYLSAVTGDAGVNTFQTNPYLMHRINILKPRFGLLEFKWRLKKAELYANLHLKRY